MVLTGAERQHPSLATDRASVLAPEWLTFIAVFVGVFLYATIFSNAPDPFDPYTRWHCALKAIENHAIVFSEKDMSAHHCMRWAVILPTALSIKFLGENLTTFYLLPIAYFALFVALLFSMLKARTSIHIASVVLILLLANPYVMNQVSEQQVRPFGWFYMLAAVYFVSLVRLRYLAIAAVFVFLAYGTKVTYLLYFTPGILAFIFFRMGVKCAIFFSFLLATFFLLETYYFNGSLGFISYGRPEVLAAGKNHFALYDLLYPNPLSVTEYLFKPWSDISVYYGVLVAVCLIYALLRISVKHLRDHTDSLTLCVMAAALSFFVCDKFGLRSLDPIIPVQPLKFDYITPGLVFVFYIFGHLLFKLTENVRLLQNVVLFAASVLLITTIGNAAHYNNKTTAKDDRTRFFAYAGFWQQERNFEIAANLMDQEYAIYFKVFPGREHHNRRIRNVVHYWLNQGHYVKQRNLKFQRANLENGAALITKVRIGIEGAKGCIVNESEGISTLGEAGFNIVPCNTLPGYPKPEEAEPAIESDT